MIYLLTYLLLPPTNLHFYLCISYFLLNHLTSSRTYLFTHLPFISHLPYCIPTYPPTSHFWSTILHTYLPTCYFTITILNPYLSISYFSPTILYPCLHTNLPIDLPQTSHLPSHVPIYLPTYTLTYLFTYLVLN